MVSSRPGNTLAARHQDQAFDHAAFDPVQSILNYAERPHGNGWSLRSALVRLAQPHPELVSGLLDTNRRLEAALKPIQTKLFKQLGPADRELMAGPLTAEPTAPYCDVRIADLGRLCASVAGDSPAQVADVAQELTADYLEQRAGSLTEVELKAVALLAVASSVERLSMTLTGWAEGGPDATVEPAPVAMVESTSRWAAHALDSLKAEAS